MRLVQVGVGGWGAHWSGEVLPSAAADGLVEVVAAVDLDTAALEAAREPLGLPASACFTDLGAALAAVEADAVAVVVPPHAHEAVIDVALEHGLDIVCEKPVADTLEAAVRVARKVAHAGVRMLTTMNHRFDQDKQSLRAEIRAARNGGLDSLTARLLTSFRARDSWGAFRHAMAHPQLIEGCVHHLDLLADLAGGTCTSVFAQTWRPAWAEYDGDPQAVVLMEFDNGVHALHEAGAANAAPLHSWHFEHIRAECEHATLVLENRRLTRYPHDPAVMLSPEPAHEDVPLLERPRWRHEYLIEQLVTWRNGGPEPATEVGRNVRSLALVFAAIASLERRTPVDPAEILAQAGAT